jgi:general secretion pathway protein E
MVDDTLKRGILERATSQELEALARKGGMVTMHEDGMDKVLRGVTTLEEVLKVTEDTR